MLVNYNCINKLDTCQLFLVKKKQIKLKINIVSARIFFLVFSKVSFVDSCEFAANDRFNLAAVRLALCAAELTFCRTQ
jgi:hypothetical protein